ncbi:hypothetical protein ACWGCC_10030 [Streptomyces nigrescens]
MMTKPTTDRLRAEVAEIEQLLVTRAWTPSRYELKLGNAFLIRARQLDDEIPADLPSGQQGFGGSRTDLLTTQACIAEMAEMLLSAWWVRLVLRRSPMRQLVAACLAAGQVLIPHAEKMLRAWRHDPPVVDTAWLDEYVRNSGLPAEEAAERVWRVTIEEWEEQHLPTHEWDEELHPADHVMNLAAMVMVAAVTGDIAY